MSQFGGVTKDIVTLLILGSKTYPENQMDTKNNASEEAQGAKKQNLNKRT